MIRPIPLLPSSAIRGSIGRALRGDRALDGTILDMETAAKTPVLLEDVSEGLLLAPSGEPWPNYNIRAIIDLSEKYHIPGNIEFIKAIYEVGATEEELASIYLHS